MDKAQMIKFLNDVHTLYKSSHGNQVDNQA